MRKEIRIFLKKPEFPFDIEKKRNGNGITREKWIGI